MVRTTSNTATLRITTERRKWGYAQVGTFYRYSIWGENGAVTSSPGDFIGWHLMLADAVKTAQEQGYTTLTITLSELEGE